MKINVTVDCTPEEARKFLGLPDVQAFQTEMMEIMRTKALENMKMMEPEAAMKTWMPLLSQNFAQGASQMQEFFNAVMTGAAKSAATTRKAAKG